MTVLVQKLGNNVVDFVFKTFLSQTSRLWGTWVTNLVDNPKGMLPTGLSGSWSSLILVADGLTDQRKIRFFSDPKPRPTRGWAFVPTGLYFLLPVMLINLQVLTQICFPEKFAWKGSLSLSLKRVYYLTKKPKPPSKREYRNPN